MPKAALSIVAFAAICGALLAQNPNRVHQLKTLETATLKFGKSSIRAWVMDSDSKRQEGMMFLTEKEVPKDHGMVFVFQGAAQRSFWMRNTLIPLDIAYLDSKGKALNVAVMKALDESPVPSAGPSKYVLEMKKGAFARLGIKKGTLFKLPATLKAKN
jgi:uncharacterized membrane protein (UPF0127 family)